MNLIEILFRTIIKDERHPNYKYVVDLKKKYRQLVLGEGIDELLVQYVKREDKILFEQRKLLTQHIVPDICKNLLRPFSKIARSNSKTRVVASETKANKDVTVLNKMLGRYWGDNSLEDYLDTRYIELNAIDPNAFIVVEWEAYQADERISPYPFEVSSEMAINYKYKNNMLQFLIIKIPHKYAINKDAIENAAEYVDGFRYVIYGQNQTYEIRQVENNISVRDIGKEGEIYKRGDLYYVQLGDNTYNFIEYLPHNLGRVPAIRVGYKRDISKDGNTYVNPLADIENHLMKLIKTNSELDIVAALLAFPQMLKYGKKCTDKKCYMGYYDNGSVCNTCKGTGIQPTAPSSQDAIVLPMPDAKEEMLPLKDIISYVHPPTDIIKWQEEYIEKITFRLKKLLFNSDVFDRKQIADTATGRNIDMDNVYDTLYPYAAHYAYAWTYQAKVIRDLAELENIVVSYTFGRDFKLKTLSDLIQDLAIANKIANTALTQHINRDIAAIIYQGRPLEMELYKIKERHNPFAGKTEKEISLLMVSTYISEKDKILYANYARIFDDVILENKNFFKLNTSKQREILYQKATAIEEELKLKSPELNL